MLTVFTVVIIKYTNTKLLCCTLDTNTMLDVNNTSIGKIKESIITVMLTMLTMCWTHLIGQVVLLAASYREILRHRKVKGTKVRVCTDTGLWAQAGGGPPPHPLQTHNSEDSSKGYVCFWVT